MSKFYDFYEQSGQDTLDITGIITSDSVEAWLQDGTFDQDFIGKLKKCGDIIVNINSPGGDVFAASAIYTALRDHPGKVIVHVTGIAASAASVIAMAGDTVLMSPTACMYIHLPWTEMQGNANDLEKGAEQLRAVGEGIITAYQKKTGKSRDEIYEMLESETMMCAQDAVDNHFADGILYDESTAKPISAMLSYKKISDEICAKLKKTQTKDERAAREKAAQTARVLMNIYTQKE